MRLSSILAGDRRPWAGPLVGLLILGTHGFGIQMATGMLDLAVVYLFLASLDSLRQEKWFLAGCEFTFFFWAKPLMPLEAMLMIVIWALAFLLAFRSRWQVIHTLVLKHWPKAVGVFLVLSIFVAGPFIVKSIYYAGTPFFPWAPGIIGNSAQIQSHPSSWHSLQQASWLWMEGTKNGYGHGRNWIAFIKHWWLLGVPQEGVNNSFDYPLGLTYLLMIGPFLFFLIKDIYCRKFCPLSILAAIIWLLWWFTSQQSRFLYLPLMIIFMMTIVRLEKLSKMLILCVLISLLFETISLWDVHHNELGKWGLDVLRVKDKHLVELNQRYLDHSLLAYIDRPDHDVAYAQFPVVVRKESLPHTISF